MQDPDPQLIRAAAAGDVPAFADLVRQVQGHVWRFLLHLVGDADLAADLTQDTLVKAYRALDGFRFESSFSTWLFRIARNCATDHFRRSARQVRLVTQVAETTRSHTPDASSAVEVKAAVAALPPHLREVFVLVEVFGLRYREAAAVLDIPDGTVKSRMFNARRSLVEWFGAQTDAVSGPSPNPSAEEAGDG
jgi:RNA polymerase sigma-70 factor (ECF subfamily)